MRFKCNGECGDEVVTTETDEEWDCIVCGGRMKKQTENVPTVPA